MLRFSSECHQGLVRERNEDSLLANKDLGLWVVADGVGGNSHGDVASQLAVQTIERRVRQGSDLTEAITQANSALLEAQASQSELSGMASTVIACHFHDNQFELSWVGDSRAYLIDSEGIHQISSDHNLANELYLQGEIEEHELQTHSGQHELTQALGQLSLTNVPKNLGELHEGDVLLLCTDGLSGPLEDDLVYKTIKEAETLDAAKDELLKLVLREGAPDNVSYVLIEYVPETVALKASDFESKGGIGAPGNTTRTEFEGTYRFPFNKKAYRKHLKNRSVMLALMLIAIMFLIFFI